MTFAREKEQPERRIYFGVPRDDGVPRKCAAFYGVGWEKPLGFVSLLPVEAKGE